MDHGRRPRSVDPVDGRPYGAQWWVVGDDVGTFWANGYEGQSIMVCPGLDLVVVRLGKSTAGCYPALASWRAALVDGRAGAERVRRLGRAVRDTGIDARILVGLARPEHEDQRDGEGRQPVPHVSALLSAAAASSRASFARSMAPFSWKKAWIMPS